MGKWFKINFLKVYEFIKNMIVTEIFWEGLPFKDNLL
jgi:hypothetical protein